MSAYDFIEKRFSDPNIDLDEIIKLMEDYATESIKASLEKASESGKVTHVNYGVIGEFIVVKESISNTENIVLL